jgi:DNA-binding transcriptional LysR family regulator
MEILPSSILERAFRSGLRLSHLRILTTFARVGRVNRVAELFNVTQPAISKQLAELEILLGMPVVVRTGRRVELTPAGEVLVKHGRQILHSLEAARRELEDLDSGLAGTLKVGAVTTVMPTLIAAGVIHLQRRTSAATLTLMEATSDTLFPLLREGELDVVVSRTRIARPLEGFEEQLLGIDPIVVACASQHPLARRKSLRWGDLTDYPWVLPPKGSAIHDGLMRVLDKHGLQVQEGGITATSITLLPRLLADGGLIGLMPRAYAREYVDQNLLTILPLSFSNPAHEVRAVWRQDHATPLLRVFLKSLTEIGGRIETAG